MPLSQFTSRMVNDQGLFQLFLMDPNDVKIELNFANSENKWGQSRINGVRPACLTGDRQ